MEIKDKRIKDIAGQRYSRWLVLEYVGSANHNQLWLCRCDCGTERIVNGSNLKKGLSKCCGCVTKDITGKQFGELRVIRYMETKKGDAYWECECSCGKKKVASGHGLRSGDTKSCGCLYGKHRITHGLSNNGPAYYKYLMSDPFRRLRLRVSLSVSKSLKRKGKTKNGRSVWSHLPYTPQELKDHLENLWEPWMNWENYGGASNDKRRTWHIDHIIPQNHFQYTAIDDAAFTECWALTNLRPLEKTENLKKGGRLG